MYLVHVTPENEPSEEFLSAAEIGEIVFCYDSPEEDLVDRMRDKFASDRHIVNWGNREGIVYNYNRGLRWIHSCDEDAEIIIPGVYDEKDPSPVSDLDVEFGYNSWTIGKTAMDKIGYFDGVLRDKFFTLDYYSRAKYAGLTAEIYSGILSKDSEGEESIEQLSFSSVIFGTKWRIEQGKLPAEFRDWIDSHTYKFTEEMVIR